MRQETTLRSRSRLPGLVASRLTARCKCFLMILFDSRPRAPRSSERRGHPRRSGDCREALGVSDQLHQIKLELIEHAVPFPDAPRHTRVRRGQGGDEIHVFDQKQNCGVQRGGSSAGTASPRPSTTWATWVPGARWQLPGVRSRALRSAAKASPDRQRWLFAGAGGCRPRSTDHSAGPAAAAEAGSRWDGRTPAPRVAPGRRHRRRKRSEPAGPRRKIQPAVRAIRVPVWRPCCLSKAG